MKMKIQKAAEQNKNTKEKKRRNRPKKKKIKKREEVTFLENDGRSPTMISLYCKNRRISEY
jgi:hypothetical protein